jgi:hypothetical protein
MGTELDSRLQDAQASEAPSIESGERPFGVTVIAAAMIANAIFAGIRTYLGDAMLSWDDVTRTDFYFELFGPFVGGVGLIVSIGLWRLQRWAWVATMTWAGINMAQALWAYWIDTPQYTAMALSVVIVLYLNQRDVQLAFIESTREIMRND